MYTKLDFDKRIRRGINALLQTEFQIGEGGKLVPTRLTGARPTPWVFISHDIRKKYCWFWNRVCTGQFKLIPTHCRFSCWKTVVKPNNIKELFECYDIFRQMNLPSKIGMDVRDYTYGAWAGFIYADSLEEGRKYQSIARKEIPNHIPVILKRGCTEMEQIQDSDKWNTMVESDLEFEKRLTDLFSFDERHFRQARWLKNEIQEDWIKRAIQIGDPFAKEMAIKHSGDPDIWKKLVVEAVTYYDEEPKKKKVKTKGSKKNNG